MNINPGDLVKISSYPSNEILVIALWKTAYSSEWQQVLCFTEKHGFRFPEEHETLWIRNGATFQAIPDKDDYLNKLVEWFSPDSIISVSPRTIQVCEGSEPKINDFCVCSICTEQASMAEPNQEDGSFICFSCRKYPIRQFY